MPPKKKSKSGLSGEGESSLASFDRRRFWDATAAENYAKLLEKT